MTTRRKIRVNIDEDQFDEPPQQPKNQEFKKELFSELGLESESADEHEDILLPYASIIKGLLYVYGDQQNPEEDVISMVHLQLQEMVSGLFTEEIIKQLIKQSKRRQQPNDLYILSDEDAHTDQQLVITNNTRIQNIFSEYLSSVFKEFRSKFVAVDKHRTAIKRKVYDQERIHQKLTYKSAIQKKQQEFNKVLSDTDDSLYNFESPKSARSVTSASYDESDQQRPVVVPLTMEQKWEKYMHDRIEEMDRSDFDKFMNLRSKTFLAKSKKKFLKFLNCEILEKQLEKEIRFLNYCLCRVLRQIVIVCFQAVGSEKFKLTRELVRQKGNTLIKRYIDRAKKFSLTRTKVQRMAHKIFQREYIKEGFLNMEKSFKLKVNDEKINFEQVDPWKKMTIERRKMWIDRVIAEKHLRDVVLLERKVKPPNDYFAFIYKRYLKSGLSYKASQEMFKRWFKDWFIGER